MAILTFEEQERRAYISGNTREAVLLAALDDADNCGSLTGETDEVLRQLTLVVTPAERRCND